MDVLDALVVLGSSLPHRVRGRAQEAFPEGYMLGSARFGGSLAGRYDCLGSADGRVVVVLRFIGAGQILTLDLGNHDKRALRIWITGKLRATARSSRPAPGAAGLARASDRSRFGIFGEIGLVNLTSTANSPSDSAAVELEALHTVAVPAAWSGRNTTGVRGHGRGRVRRGW